LFFTFSRSALVGFFAAMVWITVISKKKLFLLLTLILLMPLVFVPKFSSRLKTIVHHSDDIFGRFPAWQLSLNIVHRYPITGSGINTFHIMIPDPEKENFCHAHNVFLQLGAETGILGLTSFCVLILLFAKFVWKVYNKSIASPQSHVATQQGLSFQWIVLGITSATFGFLVNNFGDCPFIRGQMGVFFFSLIGIIKGLDRFIGEP